MTDPNILHHIATGERQQQLEKEKEEKETSEESSDEESDDVEEQETKMTYCEKLEEYGEEIGYALHEFKRSVELDLKHVYDDLINAPKPPAPTAPTRAVFRFRTLPAMFFRPAAALAKPFLVRSIALI